MRAEIRRLHGQVLLSVIYVFSMSCAGCSIGSGDPPPGDDGAPHNDPGEDPLPLNIVQVQLRNLSTAAVDTQFYAGDVASNGLPDSLFIPDNLIRTGIGNAATGILSPGESDLVAQSCSESLAIGTLGGQFLDANLGSSLGQGSIRFMQSQYQFDCGAVLVIEYNQTTGGYTTAIFEER